MTQKTVYPFKTMRITQSYDGTVSHKPHTIGIPKDYPIDEGGRDSGKDPVYAPAEMTVKRIYGVGNGGTNTIWLESAEKVMLANGKTDHLAMMLIHPNDSDLKRLKVGQTIKKGEIICHEGSDGASGNHIHLSVGMGKIKGNGWTKNSVGKYVLTCTGGAVKPEAAFYIDKAFTTVVNSKGIKFKVLPEEKYTTGNYSVNTALLNVRAKPTTAASKLKFSQLSDSAKTKILALNKNKPADGYIKGLTFTVLEVKDNWGRTPSGWVCLDYCEVIK